MVIIETKQVLSRSWDGRPFGHSGSVFIPLHVAIDSVHSRFYECSWVIFSFNLHVYIYICPLSSLSRLSVVWHFWRIKVVNRHGPKIGGCAPFWGDDLGPHLAQCRLGWGWPPYQVASGSIEPFGHNRYGPKIGGLCPFGGGAPGCPSSTVWPGLRPTCVPSFIWIRSTIWPQYSNVTDRTDRQRSDSIGPTVLQTVIQKMKKWVKVVRTFRKSEHWMLASLRFACKSK